MATKNTKVGATRNPKVEAMVEDELRKDRHVPSLELLEKAKKIDKSLEGVSIASFNASYPLQIRRRLYPRPPREEGGEEGGAVAPARQRGRRGETDRTAVRNVLVKLASDVVAADDKTGLIRVMGNLDHYVDQVVAAAGGR